MYVYIYIYILFNLHLSLQGGVPEPFPIERLLGMLSESNLALDAQETETGNTALHIAAFGGCVEMALHLAALGASLALPNRYICIYNI